MNLYLIEKDSDYDQFHGFVIAAENAEDVESFARDYANEWGGWERLWPEPDPRPGYRGGPKTITLVGTTDRPAGDVILAAFNAG